MNILKRSFKIIVNDPVHYYDKCHKCSRYAEYTNMKRLYVIKICDYYDEHNIKYLVYNHFFNICNECTDKRKIYFKITTSKNKCLKCNPSGNFDYTFCIDCSRELNTILNGLKYREILI